MAEEEEDLELIRGHLPHYIDYVVSLSTRLSRNIALSVPCVSSPTDTVTESYMASAMTTIGAIGIIHSNLTPSQQAHMVRFIKSRHVPILSNPVVKSRDSRIFDEFDDDSVPCVLVTESGSAESKLMGYVTKANWFGLDDKEMISVMLSCPVFVLSSWSVL